jgi:hypothetical protein
MNLYTIDAYNVWERLLNGFEFERFTLADYKALLAFDEKSDYTGRYMGAHNRFIVKYGNIKSKSISDTFQQHLLANKRCKRMLPSYVLRMLAEDTTSDLLFRCMLNAVSECYDITECLKHEFTPDEISKIRLTYAEYGSVRGQFRVQEQFKKVTNKLQEYQAKGVIDSNLKLVFDEKLGKYMLN